MYDLIIIGGGPAGVSAGVYAARKKLKTFFITKDFEGQSAVSDNIENWIGSPAISGKNLALSLEKHLKMYASDTFTIQTGDLAKKVAKVGDTFEVTLESGKVIAGKSILIASGSSRRKLNVPGADRLEHKGLTYCASCDGPIFADQDVVVVGGGNAGFESAAQLLAYCKSVTILHRNKEFKADALTIEKVLAHPKAKGIPNVDILEITGEKFVNGLVYKDKATGETVTLPVTGIFVEIGGIPNSDMVKDIVELDPYGRIIVNPKTQRSSVPGLYAAGDVTDGMYHQNNIAAGDAVKALEDLYLYLKARG